MHEHPRFDRDSVRDSWDRAADAYAHGQGSGRDFYRYEFFGPAHVDACGDVNGLRLIDVGCGSGYFTREMARRGALVTGIDVSERMIDHAARIEQDTPLGITYKVCDAADLAASMPSDSFDMATACLSLQDMSDIPSALAAVFALLRPGARFVASITHPCSNPPFRRWQRDIFGRKRWLCIDRYFDRGPVQFLWSRWKYEFCTVAMHATLEDWFGWILGTGFQLRALHEPRPSEQALHLRPKLEDAARVPYFLILDLLRPADAGAP